MSIGILPVADPPHWVCTSEQPTNPAQYEYRNDAGAGTAIYGTADHYSSSESDVSTLALHHPLLRWVLSGRDCVFCQGSGEMLRLPAKALPLLAGIRPSLKTQSKMSTYSQRNCRTLLSGQKKSVFTRNKHPQSNKWLPRAETAMETLSEAVGALEFMEVLR